MYSYMCFFNAFVPWWLHVKKCSITFSWFNPSINLVTVDPTYCVRHTLSVNINIKYSSQQLLQSDGKLMRYIFFVTVISNLYVFSKILHIIAVTTNLGPSIFMNLEKTNFSLVVFEFWKITLGGNARTLLSQGDFRTLLVVILRKLLTTNRSFFFELPNCICISNWAY